MEERLIVGALAVVLLAAALVGVRVWVEWGERRPWIDYPMMIVISVCLCAGWMSGMRAIGSDVGIGEYGKSSKTSAAQGETLEESR